MISYTHTSSLEPPRDTFIIIINARNDAWACNKSERPAGGRERLCWDVTSSFRHQQTPERLTSSNACKAIGPPPPLHIQQQQQQNIHGWKLKTLPLWWIDDQISPLLRLYICLDRPEDAATNRLFGLPGYTNVNGSSEICVRQRSSNMNAKDTQIRRLFRSSTSRPVHPKKKKKKMCVPSHHISSSSKLMCKWYLSPSASQNRPTWRIILCPTRARKTRDYKDYICTKYKPEEERED